MQIGQSETTIASPAVPAKIIHARRSFTRKFDLKIQIGEKIIKVNVSAPPRASFINGGEITLIDRRVSDDIVLTESRRLYINFEKYGLEGDRYFIIAPAHDMHTLGYIDHEKFIMHFFEAKYSGIIDSDDYVIFRLGSRYFQNTPRFSYCP